MLKLVDGFNGRYAVDTSGKVYSMVVRNGGLSDTPVKELTAHSNKGYMRVALRKSHWNDPLKCQYVHKLVALAFIPNPDGHTEVNHKDGDKSNNSVDNLEWVTHQENISHAWETGLTTCESMLHKCESTFVGTHTKTGEKIVLVGKEALIKAGFTPSGVYRAFNGERKHHKHYVWDVQSQINKKGS